MIGNLTHHIYAERLKLLQITSLESTRITDDLL